MSRKGSLKVNLNLVIVLGISVIQGYNIKTYVGVKHMLNQKGATYGPRATSGTPRAIF